MTTLVLIGSLALYLLMGWGYQRLCLAIWRRSAGLARFLMLVDPDEADVSPLVGARRAFFLWPVAIARLVFFAIMIPPLLAMAIVLVGTGQGIGWCYRRLVRYLLSQRAVALIEADKDVQVLLDPEAPWRALQK